MGTNKNVKAPIQTGLSGINVILAKPLRAEKPSVCLNQSSHSLHHPHHHHSSHHHCC